jgi:hypothetical protein
LCVFARADRDFRVKKILFIARVAIRRRITRAFLLERMLVKLGSRAANDQAASREAKAAPGGSLEEASG